MVKRVAERSRNCPGKCEELFVIAGVAGNKPFGYSLGTHRSPFVVVPKVAISEPDSSQIFEAPVLRYLHRRNMTMVIEQGQWLSELEIELFAGRGREQEILG